MAEYIRKTVIPALFALALLSSGFAKVEAAESIYAFTPPAPEKMVPTSGLKCDQGTLALSVGPVINGKESNVIRRASISNDLFAEAVRSTLSGSGLLVEEERIGEAMLEVRANIARSSHSASFHGFLKPESVTSKLSVSYRIVDRSSNKILWQKHLHSTFTSHYQETASEFNTLIPQAYEGVARDNLEQLSTSICDNLTAISNAYAGKDGMEIPVAGAVPWPDINENNSQFRLTAGPFTSDRNPDKLTGGGNTLAFGVGITENIASIEYVSFDFDTLSIYRQYDTTIPSPLFSRISDSMTLQTVPIMGGFRFSYPSRGSFHIYANGGAGMFFSTLTVNGSTFGIPGEIEEKDSSWGWYTGAGLSLDVKDNAFAIDYKKLSVKGNFKKFGISDADIGGELIGLSYVMYF